MLSRPEISVLLPASLVADSSDLRQVTFKVGLVGRALAIFRVSRVCIYNDDEPNVRNQETQARTIETLLSYLETPQYLRKILFPHSEVLKYAGLLSPLRTPSHPLQDERNRKGDCREGVVIESGQRSILEIGLPQKGIYHGKLPLRQRVTVRLGDREGDFIQVTPVSRGEVQDYWGFKILRAESLAEGLKAVKADYYIGTSRRGQNLYEAVQAIMSSKPRSMAVAFGGPYAGLFEICRRQGVDASDLFDVIMNAVPNQGTATVRTEEALVATLSLLNALIEG
ncbi:MAG: putative RNA uridine N3 methyltransferase [Candidatus Hadarchaeum sp.]|uniref:putative RNA uridine N3 methyltransferase n=1 Tax=Candidatus Hadarchaeum sp. TaxID=2883567 RepID=UPI003D0D835A